MALARKPKARTAEVAPAVDIDALINKGGTVATDKTPAAAEPIKPESDTVPVALRLPGSFASRINEARQSRAVKIPRHTWILEAISEKLERDGF